MEPTRGDVRLPKLGLLALNYHRVTILHSSNNNESNSNNNDNKIKYYNELDRKLKLTTRTNSRRNNIKQQQHEHIRNEHQKISRSHQKSHSNRSLRLAGDLQFTSSLCGRLTITILVLACGFHASLIAKDNVVVGAQTTNDTAKTNSDKAIEPTTTSNSHIDSSPVSPIILVVDSVDQSLAAINQINNNDTNSQQHKPKNVNFTQVDEQFNAVLGHEELLSKWRLMDNQMQEGVRSILKMIFPQIVAISQDAKVSGECSGGILKWILNLRNLRSWAIKMLDASGKPTSGVFQGSLSMLGNYGQCLGIRAPDEDEIEITDKFEEYFRGRYCVLHMRPWMPEMKPYYHLNATIESLQRKNFKYYERTMYDDLAEIASAFNFVHMRMDLCVPSVCTEADIQRVADLLARKLEMRAKVMRCDTELYEGQWWAQLDSSSYVWITIAVVLVAIPLLACLIQKTIELGCLKLEPHSWIRECLECLSLCSIVSDRITIPSRLCKYSTSNNKPQKTGTRVFMDSLTFTSPFSHQNTIGSVPIQPEGSSVLEHQTTSSSSSPGASVSQTSLETTLEYEQQSKLKPSRSLDSTAAIMVPQLYTIRNVLIFWFILIQLSAELNYQYLRESLLLRDLLYNYWPLQLIVNTGFLFQSLVFLTGFTFAFNNLGSSCFQMIIQIILKCIRLSLAQLAVISLTIALPLIRVQSPIWRNLVEQQASVCKANGYLNLLFLQNFIAYDNICLPHTWLICVELQLTLLSIPLVLLIGRTMKSSSPKKEDSSFGNNKQETHNKGLLEQFISSLSSLSSSLTGFLVFQLILIGILVNFLIVRGSNLPPAWFSTFPEQQDKNSYFGQYLTKPWTHMSCYLIALLAGSLAKWTLARRTEFNFLDSKSTPINNQISVTGEPKNSPTPSNSSEPRSESNSSSGSQIGSTMVLTMGSNPNNSQFRDNQIHQASRSWFHSKKVFLLELESNSFLSTALGLLIPLTAMLSTIYSTFVWSTRELPSNSIAALYDASSRIIWSLSMAVIVIRFALKIEGNTTTHHQSSDNQAKHLPTSARDTRRPLFILLLLGRLSLVAYIISPLMNNLLLAVQEQPLFPSQFIMFHLILGNWVLIYIVSFMVANFIEQPLSRLSNYILNSIRAY